MVTGEQPPGPPARRFSGHLRDFARENIHFFHRAARDYGDVVCLRMLWQPHYLVNHPDYIKEILVTNHRNFTKSEALRLGRIVLGEGLLTSEHDFHKRQRQMIQPAFHQQRIAQYARIMAEYAVRHAERWEAAGLHGRTVDMSQEMMRLTLAIVAKSLFDADVEEEADDIGRALTTVMGVFDRIALPFARLLGLLPTPRNALFFLARVRLFQTIQRMIDERRAHPKDRGDLLSMLLEAQDQEDGRGMSDNQIRDEALTIFLAGHETTSNALMWTWYLLSQHPEVETKLHAELDEVLGGATPAAADVPRLEYTRRVLTESMRLYPPAYLIGRTPINNFKLGPYLIKKGSPVLVSPYIVQRDPRYYEEPERFNPDRWAAESFADRNRFTYFPFGGGPRTCIGEGFAWMEGILVIAAIAQRWRMELEPGHPIELLPRITLRSKHGMRMTLLRRQPAPAAATAV